MARTNSGANQVLRVNGIRIEREDGLTNFSLTPTTDTYTTTSEGVTVAENAGGVALEGSFAVLETENTQEMFLGKNGSREELQWTLGVQTAIDDQVCVLLVEHTFEDRGPRRFNITFLVDGPPT